MSSFMSVANERLDSIIGVLWDHEKLVHNESSNICLTVSGSLKDSQTGWSSPDIRYE